jgi:hypothetical protein
VPPKKCQEVVAAVYSFLFLNSLKQLGDPAGRLLYQAKMVIEDGMDGPNREPMHGGKLLDYYPLVILYDGDRCQDVAGLLSLLHTWSGNGPRHFTNLSQLL